MEAVGDVILERDRDARVEEEEDDDEEDEDEEEEAVERPAERDGVLDGGIAEPVRRGDDRRSATDADITLFLHCDEAIERYADHPVLKPGVTVQIGLDKNTKLCTVFERYVEFCNERGGAESMTIDERDLEFVHSEVLSGQDTPEGAALMKNDRIMVRAERTAERHAEQLYQKLQREWDKNYFNQLRSLVPLGSTGSRYADVLLDCQGTVYDEAGRIQRVLCTAVRCHSSIVSKRCPWLGRQITAAREQEARRSIMTVVVTSVPGSLTDDQDQDRKSPQPVAKESEDEDDIGLLNFGKVEPDPRSLDGAAQIENDDDDHVSDAEQQPERPAAIRQEMDEASLESNREDDPALIHVTLQNHTPDAVRVLLEYCYTNRVVQLGYEAFMQSCRTKQTPNKPDGPAAPHPVGHPRRWPNQGQPIVSFRTALAALTLAEEACIPRLSLMCEIAAAQLVGTNNVVDALTVCETQKTATGNSLPTLRKAAMDVVLRSGPRGVYALPTFRRALEDRSASLVPTLLTGTAEIVLDAEKKKKQQHAGNKRDWKTAAFEYFDDLDYTDACAREQERHRRRVERKNNDPRTGPLSEEEEKKLFEKPRRKDDIKRRSLKRMSHHLGGGGRVSNRVVASLSSRRGSSSQRRVAR